VATVPTDSSQDWHLNKGVTIALIGILTTVMVTGLGAFLTALFAFAEVRKDIELLKSTQAISASTSAERDQRQDRMFIEGLSLLRQDIQAVQATVNRLIERDYGNGIQRGGKP
jgi:hypothetical protein